MLSLYVTDVNKNNFLICIIAECFYGYKTNLANVNSLKIYIMNSLIIKYECTCFASSIRMNFPFYM